MTLSYTQLMDLWKQAGGSPASAPVAAAVAIAESGGNPQSHNPVPPDNSYGLWQINMLGSLGPARSRTFGLSSYDQLFDPLTNAKAAVAIASGGSNWQPWSTYTSGAYQKYLNGTNSPAPGDANVGGAGATPNATAAFNASQTSFLGGLWNWITGQPLTNWNPVEGMTSQDVTSKLADSAFGGFLAPLEAMGTAAAFLSKFMNFVMTKLFLPSTWVRVAAFGAGSILIITGLFVFFVGSAPIKAVEGIAGVVK